MLPTSGFIFIRVSVPALFLLYYVYTTIDLMY